MTADFTVRCERSELPKVMCAHCKGLVDVPVSRELGRPFKAVYAGACVQCGERFAVGDRIRSDSEHGGYVGPCCEEDA